MNFQTKLGNMKEIKKYTSAIFPPDIARIRELTRRAWQIYINPPKETRIYNNLENTPEVFTKVSEHQTKRQPKQVAVSQREKLAFVTCMEGNALQVFDYSKDLQLVDEVFFTDQCVETTVHGDICFVTTSNFQVDGDLRNKLWLLDTKSRQVISNVDTQGNWSKVIAIHPDGKHVFISNWQSNSISIINIDDIVSPQVEDVITKPKDVWKSPRGIVFTKNGKKALVTGFYSRNIIELDRYHSKWEVEYYSPRFDEPHYGGNMRHIIISPDDKFAYISNKGRNLLHIWSIRERKFIDSIVVGKEPNTIDYYANSDRVILVSCGGVNRVCLVDLQSQQIIGKSETTGKTPTGLCAITSGFLVTSFDGNKIEKHLIKI